MLLQIEHRHCLTREVYGLLAIPEGWDLKSLYREWRSAPLKNEESLLCVLSFAEFLKQRGATELKPKVFDLFEGKVIE